MKKTPNCFWSFRPNVNFRRLLLPVKIVVLLLFCRLAIPAYTLAAVTPFPDDQQQVRVTGTVTDATTNEAMPGVNILVKGTALGAITDVDGKYAVNVTDRNASLVFSFIGYVTQEIPLAGRVVIDVTLKAVTTDLDEVVVVGYSTQKRANVVGSVTSISGDAIQSIPSASVASAISGRLPGSVVIQQNGEPGNLSTRIMVRGRSTLGGDRTTNATNIRPLVVIDGVQNRSMDEIDPNDIASLSVLKDAAASIYGASAANGVILITTKKGQEGLPRLNYQFYQGFMTPTVVPETTNAAEYAQMVTEYQINQGKTRTYSDADIELFKNGKDPWRHPDTNWYKELIKDWTTTYRHNLSIDGGAKGMNYYVSFGLKGDEPMYKVSSTKYKQYNVRAKVEMPITSWLKTGVDLAGFLTNRIYPWRGVGDIIGSSTRNYPTTWAYWPSKAGEPRLPGPDIEYGDNPVVTSTFAGGKDDQKTYRMLTTFSSTITVPFVKGLTFNGNFSFDLTNFYRKRFFLPFILYYPNWPSATIDPVTGFVTSMTPTPTLRGPSTPNNQEDYQRTINQTGLVNVNYTRQFGNHNLTLYGAYEQFKNDYNNIYAYRTYYISDLIQTMDAGSTTDQSTTGSRSVYARKSLIGRVTYDYKSKYLAEFIFRRDGSLKFPPSGRWGNFPGVLLGWRASEEDFWKANIRFINYFKLRASWGQMGMDPGNSFQFIDKYGLSSGMVFGTGSSIETVVGPPTIANPNITWEKQTTYNVGFESKFLNDLFSLNMEFFYNRRSDILATKDASVPSYTGLSLPQQNIGIVDNKGFEIEAGVHKNVTSDLRMDLTGNFSFARNKVVFKDEPKVVVDWQRTTGHPYGAWLMYDCIGVFKDQTAVNNYAHWSGAKPGDLIFRDRSGDGTITSDDRILIDNCDAPEIFYGAMLDATWKDFTLSVQIQGQGKYLRQNISDERRGESGNYMKWQYNNRWTAENTNTNIPRAYERNNYYWAFSVNMNDFWLDNTAYCRLKNLVLTYNIPSKLYKGIGISRASVYFSGNNLALIYAGTKKFDPETDGIAAYPLLKTFAFGANVTF